MIFMSFMSKLLIKPSNKTQIQLHRIAGKSKELVKIHRIYPPAVLHEILTIAIPSYHTPGIVEQRIGTKFLDEDFYIGQHRQEN